ncbi:hypothetical protein MAM1_0301c09432 [Mucor ambiguus]|uniref:LysM domain-containing protein n=1 Tax=Mucor ambiguus TaxID=91626 RepID=A0A0C9MR13_9FUNG|nr:hypothetical protein MAM1_0301c09432 [Mucor ambiguus]
MKLSLLVSSVLSAASLIQAADHYSHPCEETYNVVYADDCKSIAAAYGVTEAKLEQWNQYFNPKFQCDGLKAGDHVCVQFNEKLMKRAAVDAHKKKGPGPHNPKKPAHQDKKKGPTHQKAAAHHKKSSSHGKAAAHKKSVVHKMASTHKKEAAHHKKAPAQKKPSSHHKKNIAHKKAPAQKKEAVRGKKSSHHKKASPHKKAPVHKGLGKRSHSSKSGSGAANAKLHKKEKKHHKKEKKSHKHGKHQDKKQQAK